MNNKEKSERGNQVWTIQRKPKGAIKYGQSRDTGNIGYTRDRTKITKQYKTQHKKQKIDSHIFAIKTYIRLLHN